MNKFKILIYTDSRGQHVPKGSSHMIYGKRIQEDPRFDVTLCLCKMKWTTTLDFLEYLETDSDYYDLIILHTGIVEQSPRHQSIALNSLYRNEKGPYDYANFSKTIGGIINQKKAIFDKVFGEIEMEKHLKTDLGVMYENEHTVNMYSLDMLQEKLIPRLKRIPNLVWISGNKIVPKWNGNYFKERPTNINLIEEYSRKEI